MKTLPLLVVDSLDAHIASYRNVPVAAREFVAQAEYVAQALPRAAHVINLSENRYHFLLGWVAACLRGQVTLLPSSRSDDVVGKLRHEHPDHHTIDDVSMASICSRKAFQPAESIPAGWQLPADHIVAIAFTSGSTGDPTSHPKTWGSLFQNSRLAASQVLGSGNRAVVSTVPPQHMYGLEASLLSALTAGSVLFDDRPFYPADVRHALEAMTAPRVLVTTPAHLKVLAEADVKLPPLGRVVSATAPLPVELALRIETEWNTQVMEIYGCTEAGVMAHRRPAQSETWRTFEGGMMSTNEGVTEYFAPQLAGPVPLHDDLDLQSATEFQLRSRSTDMIKVAGKRGSLLELTRQILAIAGVHDAAVFMPDNDARPAAAVVAPGLSAADILRELRARIDGVFVPRPLVIVDELPRNSVGKLPRETLLRLLAKSRT